MKHYTEIEGSIEDINIVITFYFNLLYLNFFSRVEQSTRTSLTYKDGRIKESLQELLSALLLALQARFGR